jgi:hypothetical protein
MKRGVTMAKYIIYPWDGVSWELDPFHVESKDKKEALEILCVSKRAKTKFIPENKLTKQEFDLMKLNSKYMYIDATELGGTRGFLLVDKMIIREREEVSF